MDQLKTSLSNRSPLGRYGLADTWVGFATYAVERWPRGKSKKLLDEFLTFFEKKAKHLPQGVSWYSTKNSLPYPNPEEFNSGNYNLGVAHGVAGVIGFLAQACQLDVSQTTSAMLESASQWLVAQDRGKPFGYWVPSNSSRRGQTYPQRASWCYGDLGNSIILLNAARVLKNRELEKRSLEVAKRAAQFSNSKMQDPTFCHGAIGASHIFNRLYRLTGETLFLEKSLYWVKSTLSLADSAYLEREKYGVLLGNTGIALGLLAALSDISPDWDRMFLISLKEI